MPVQPGWAQKLLRGAEANVADDTDWAQAAGERAVGGKDAVNNRGDAMRHMLISAKLTQKYGPEVSRILTELHEQVFADAPAEAAMDRHNNRVGRELGIRKPRASRDLLEAKAGRLLEKRDSYGRDDRTLPRWLEGGRRR